jgi:uncharacterized protein YegP (UPF0339 family)
MMMRTWSVGLGALFMLLAGATVGESLAPGQLRAAQVRARVPRQLKFEIYRDAAKKYRWRLKAANGEILATAGQGYQSKESAKRGVASVKAGAGNGKLKFQVYQDKKKEYRWRLKAANGQEVAASSEGYKAKRDCDHAIDLIKKGAARARVEEK